MRLRQTDKRVSRAPLSSLEMTKTPHIFPLKPRTYPPHPRNPQGHFRQYNKSSSTSVTPSGSSRSVSHIFPGFRSGPCSPFHLVNDHLRSETRVIFCELGFRGDGDLMPEKLMWAISRSISGA
ncbi:hypothetical protein AAC387_Pa01g0863 [Persea americana]